MTIIAFEGIDGAGKSTQIRRLSEWFQRRGMQTCVTCEPTKGPHGAVIRSANPRLPSSREREEFVLDRIDHYNLCIKPAIEKGEVVLTDRYYYSSMAYQGARIAQERSAGQVDDALLDEVINEIREENENVTAQADILILFDLSVEAAMRRIECNRASADGFETRENLARVARAFERTKLIVQKTSQTRVITVNAELSPDEVADAICTSVQSILGLE